MEVTPASFAVQFARHIIRSRRGMTPQKVHYGPLDKKQQAYVEGFVKHYIAWDESNSCITDTVSFTTKPDDHRQRTWIVRYKFDHNNFSSGAKKMALADEIRDIARATPNVRYMSVYEDISTFIMYMCVAFKNAVRRRYLRRFLMKCHGGISRASRVFDSSFASYRTLIRDANTPEEKDRLRALQRSQQSRGNHFLVERYVQFGLCETDHFWNIQDILIEHSKKGHVRFLVKEGLLRQKKVQKRSNVTLDAQKRKLRGEKHIFTERRAYSDRLRHSDVVLNVAPATQNSSD